MNWKFNFSEADAVDKWQKASRNEVEIILFSSFLLHHSLYESRNRCGKNERKGEEGKTIRNMPCTTDICMSYLGAEMKTDTVRLEFQVRTGPPIRAAAPIGLLRSMKLN